MLICLRQLITWITRFLKTVFLTISLFIPLPLGRLFRPGSRQRRVTWSRRGRQELYHPPLRMDAAELECDRREEQIDDRLAFPFKPPVFSDGEDGDVSVHTARLSLQLENSLRLLALHQRDPHRAHQLWIASLKLGHLIQFALGRASHTRAREVVMHATPCQRN